VGFSFCRCFRASATVRPAAPFLIKSVSSVVFSSPASVLKVLLSSKAFACALAGKQSLLISVLVEPESKSTFSILRDCSVAIVSHISIVTGVYRLLSTLVVIFGIGSPLYSFYSSSISNTSMVLSSRIKE
jgi:hypothetical protein